MSDESPTVIEFKMPHGEILQIRSSSPNSEDITIAQHLEGVVYHISWNENEYPWSIYTRSEACSIAHGCQWAAYEMNKEELNDFR